MLVSSSSRIDRLVDEGVTSPHPPTPLGSADGMPGWLHPPTTTTTTPPRASIHPHSTFLGITACCTAGNFFSLKKKKKTIYKISRHHFSSTSIIIPLFIVMNKTSLDWSMMHDRNIYCYQLISSTFEHRSSRDLISDTRRTWMLRMIDDIDILLHQTGCIDCLFYWKWCGCSQSTRSLMNKIKTYCSSWIED